MTPAEPDTFKTAMIRAQCLTSLTGQEWTLFTNDQQLYKVAVHVSCVEQDLFPQFVPRLGGMHMMMSFVGAVGFLMSGTGLEDILKSTLLVFPNFCQVRSFPRM
jgi:hypothetical protein